MDENSTATNSNSSAQTEALTNEPGFASNTKDVCENLDQESRLTGIYTNISLNNAFLLSFPSLLTVQGVMIIIS